jgi:YVTN family beta-propeller protein
LFAAATFLTLIPAAPTIAAADWSDIPVTHVEIPIPEDAPAYRSNIIDLDQTAHRLYTGDGALGGIDVFDISGPIANYMTTVPVSGGAANGVSVGANVHRVYAGLNDSSVAIIDTDPSSSTYNTVVANPNTGGEKRADEMDYDPVDRKLYVANSDDGFVSVIDGRTDQIIKKIGDLGPGLEQPRYNPIDGMMYMTGTGLNVLYKFDPKNDTLVKTYDVVDPCNPNGLAINPKTNQALLGCSSRAAYRHVAVWDFAAEKVVQIILGPGAGNTSIYDPQVDLYFFVGRTNGDDQGTAIYSGAAPVRLLGTVNAGKAGGGSVVFDETNGIVYVHDIRSDQPLGLASFPLPQ